MAIREDFTPGEFCRIDLSAHDLDAAAAWQATSSEGRVKVSPTQIPVGEFSVLSGPQGGLFAVITPSEPKSQVRPLTCGRTRTRFGGPRSGRGAVW